MGLEIEMARIAPDYFEQRIRARWPFVLAACLTLVLLLAVEVMS